jgi:pimeloyl-ACP methyl ester carboxylesterase
MEIHDDLAALAAIEPEERDYNLKLQDLKWGSTLSSRKERKWARAEDPHWHFTREVPVHTYKGSRLHESVVPFPSAPIYGINRKAEYGKRLTRPNMHTIRVLRRPESTGVSRLFILHNGLNEADDMKFYYRLADWLLRAHESRPPNQGAACLIMPFPGHLTHFSFHGPFSETPLSRYLNDSGELFRQFLRHMIGIRWLLGMVADSNAKDWMVGAKMLKAHAFETEDLAKEILVESDALFSASRKRLENTEAIRKKEKDTEQFSNLDPGEVTTVDQIATTIKLLRSALMRGDSAKDTPPLRVHVVGYSLGGFVAQSVFFAWPQIVSSCTTICSGGAISALSPTAFAHPEEWQSVLHSLRPELSNSMLQGRLGDDYRKGPAPVSMVAGMPLRRFGYFQRIFEQVFLQEDRGSYKERLSEYGLRMLFVSGGEDPIVPPTNILDASPEEGITMLSVAGMTHFLNQDPRGARKDREKDQRDFWLPEAGGLIARAAIRAEQIHLDERASAEKFKEKRVRKRRVPAVRMPLDDTLSSSEAFESALDWVLDTVTDENGWLLVCRNALPAAFIHPTYFTRWGKGLHHHDVRVQQYAAGLRRRAHVLDAVRSRTTLIVPEQLEHWFIHLTAQFDAHSDAPSGRMTTEETRERIWKGFEKRWWECTRQFNPEERDSDDEFDRSGLDRTMATWQDVDEQYLDVTHLPDVWIGIHPESKSMYSAPHQPRKKAHEAIVDGVKQMLSREPARKRVFEEDHANNLIRVVRVSGAEFNPRYRGRIETSKTSAKGLLARCAAGLVRSAPMANPELEEAADGSSASR